MAVQPGLCGAWSETPKTGFLTTRFILSNDGPTSVETCAVLLLWFIMLLVLMSVSVLHPGHGVVSLSKKLCPHCLVLVKPRWPSLHQATCSCDSYPLTPHLYIVKLRLTGVYIIFLYLLLNIDCGYSLEPPHLCGSNEYPQSMF